MVKRCAWGTCKTDSRYPERLEGGVFFFPFPKPKSKPDKCRLWIKLCGHPHSQLNPSRIDRHTFVCSKVRLLSSTYPTIKLNDSVFCDFDLYIWLANPNYEES